MIRRVWSPLATRCSGGGNSIARFHYKNWSENKTPVSVILNFGF
jgi:hypothetical protein